MSSIRWKYMVISGFSNTENIVITINSFIFKKIFSWDMLIAIKYQNYTSHILSPTGGHVREKTKQTSMEIAFNRCLS